MDKLWLSPKCINILNWTSTPRIHSNYTYNDLIEVTKALNVFKWQSIDSPQKSNNFEDANYRIMTYEEYNTYMTVYGSHYARSLSNKFYVVFLSDEEFNDAMLITEGRTYNWRWKYSDDNPGYEVTSRGDRRFSPFFQYVNDTDGTLITAENWYKKYIELAKKIGTYVPGTGHKFMYDYITKYRGLMFELAVIGCNLPFTDMFDKDGGQNKWYSEFLNDYRIKRFNV